MHYILHIFVACWTPEDDTNVLGGVVNSADTVEKCQAACINNGSCTGVDWDGNAGVPDGRKCWLSGPWSGDKGQANGVTHYTLNRNCTGTDYQMSRLLMDAILR